MTKIGSPEINDDFWPSKQQEKKAIKMRAKMPNHHQIKAYVKCPNSKQWPFTWFLKFSD